ASGSAVGTELRLNALSGATLALDKGAELHVALPIDVAVGAFHLSDLGLTPTLKLDDGNLFAAPGPQLNTVEELVGVELRAGRGEQVAVVELEGRREAEVAQVERAHRDVDRQRDVQLGALVERERGAAQRVEAQLGADRRAARDHARGEAGGAADHAAGE